MKDLLTAVKTKPIVAILPAVVVLSIVLFVAHRLFADHTRYVTGTVEATQVDVASKIPARIRTFVVEEGMPVAAGDTLVRFENREVSAKVGQARAAMDAASAKYSMAMRGARKEEIAMAEDSYRQAGWGVEVLKKTYDRMKALHDEGVISAQQWDEVDYRYRAAVEQREAARERYQMVKLGAREEEKKAARALYQQAENAVAEAQSYYDETSLSAPIAGVVEKKMVDAGELVAAGYPIISLVNPQEWWVIVNIDERSIGSLAVGKTLPCVIPSKNDAVITMRVARLSAMSDFATKKVTNELNSFDTRTIEVKLVPEDRSLSAIQGSSVLVPVVR